MESVSTIMCILEMVNLDVKNAIITQVIFLDIEIQQNNINVFMENSEHAYIQRVLNDYKKNLAEGEDIGKQRPGIIDIVKWLNNRIINGNPEESDFLTKIRDEYQKLING